MALESGNGVLNKIAKKQPQLADQVGEYMAHMLCALNAYHHDIFQRMAPPIGEDLETDSEK